MRALAIVSLAVVGCGGSSSSFAPSNVIITGSGTITASSATVTVSAQETVRLDDAELPSGLDFTFAGGGRSAEGDLDALVTAFGQTPLDELTGTELTVNQVFNGSGALSYTGQGVQNLSYAYVVESYSKPAATTAPFLTLQVSSSSAGTSVYGSLAFQAQYTLP